MAERAIHFPGLNGVRALAAVSVVVSHITIRLKDFGLDPFLFGAFEDGRPRGLDLASHGVTIFFALSGFLITSLLLAEHGPKGTNKVNILYFYNRRILRIWPLYYAYFAIVLVVLFAQGRPPSGTSMALYAFFAANVAFLTNEWVLVPIAHFWSLAVEEQFYMFWPWVLRKRSKFLLWICLLGIAVQFIAKLICYKWFPDSLVNTFIGITRFHCMLIGAAAAVLHASGTPWFRKLTDNRITQMTAWSVIALLLLNRFHIASIIDREIVACITVLIIMGQLSATNKILDLERPLLDRLGKISYGIYVVHPLVIYVMSNWMARMFDPASGGGGGYILLYTTALGATIGLAQLSYIYLERPFLLLKSRFTVVESQPERSA